MAPGVLHRSVGLGIATHRHCDYHEARSDSLTTVSSILSIGDAGLKCWLAPHRTMELVVNSSCW